MKRFVLALAALASGAGLCSFALAGNYPSLQSLPIVSVPFAPQETPTKFREAAKNIDTYGPGLLYSLPAISTATAAATTQTLASYTITAGNFQNTGQAVRIKAVFTFAANTNNRTPIITFGTYTLTGTLNATSAGSESLECLVVRTGASTQSITCTGMTQTTPIVNTYTAGTSPDTADIAVTGQCTQGSASADCTLATFIVESLR
jgi:hypothetical protein